MEQALPRCSVCGKPSDKTWVMQDDPRKIFCERCKDLPKCSFCGNAGRRTEDGLLVICRTCEKSALADPGEAQKLFGELRRELKNVCGIGTDHKIRFSLASAARLAQLKKGPLDPRQRGLFQHEQQMRTEQTYDRLTGKTVSRKTSLTGERFSIFILQSLPRAAFRHAVIHELTHDWMSQFCPQIKDPAVREGTCEYVAWLFLQQTVNGDPAQRFVCKGTENNPDPVYGGGFRKMRRIAGEGSVRKRIARLKDFLSGRD